MPDKVCPGCATKLYPMNLGGIEVDTCPKCAGIWFDRGELGKAVGLSIAAAENLPNSKKAKMSRRICPTCRRPLMERELGRSSGIMVDECRTCSGTWLDKGEMARIEKLAQKRRRELGLSGRTQAQKKAIKDKGKGTVMFEDNSLGAAVFQLFLGLPAESNVPQKLFSPMVTLLIAANVIVYVLMHMSGSYDELIGSLGVVPRDIMAGRNLHTLITSMFTHGGFFHIFGNMYFLWITGDNVEERCGWWKFIVFYLIAGLMADFLHIAIHPDSAIPSVGASGAISGLMGAYMVLFPTNKFIIRRFIYWRPVSFEIPALFYFGFWILMQFFYAWLAVPGIGWFAHIGGFVTGVIFGFLIRAFFKPAENEIIGEA